MATRKGGLGKGLEALFVENETDEITPSTLKIGEIEPNRGQPRHDFDETALAELADSIREHGVLQPLLVRPMPNGKYQIVAGERRWRASRMAGLTELPVIIRDLDEAAAMEVALIENLQRSDLNPMEEAMGYQELMQQHGYTQEQVAKRVGKSRPAVANALRLLALPEETARLVRDGKLSSGHARALLGLPEAALPLADAVVLVATAPKSNSAHNAYYAALADVQAGRSGPIPRQLQNKHFDGEDAAVKGQHYKYAHDYPNHWVEQQYLPDSLQGVHYYTFGDNKAEQAVAAYWKRVKGAGAAKPGESGK